MLNPNEAPEGTIAVLSMGVECRSADESTKCFFLSNRGCLRHLDGSCMSDRHISCIGLWRKDKSPVIFAEKPQ